MRKPPKRIVIEGDVITVQDNVSRMRRTALGHPTVGDYAAKTIRLASGTRSMVKRENLFHELLHAVWEKAKLDETYARSTEEFVISSLGGWLLDTLKDNPDLRDYLFEEGEDGG